MLAKKVVLLCALVAAACFSACRVQYAASYDPIIDQGVTTFQSHADLACSARMEQDATYDGYGYASLYAELQALITRAHQTPMNGPTVAQLVALQHEILLIDSVDKHGASSVDMLRVSQETIDSSCAKIIATELDKKRGTK